MTATPETAAPTIPGMDHVATLASGGFADVHLYDQRVPSRRVAVKVLRDAVGAGGAAAFLAEADALARLEHPHVVGVHGVGLAGDGRPYLVMPFYPGPDLGTRSAGAGLDVEEVLRVGVQVGGALETAHRRGLLHRDVKPANILTGPYGEPGLADFGLAAGPDADLESGVSVPWTAPEVLFGTAAPSVRSDVYSLAATLWTLLAGHPPFEAAAVAGAGSGAELLRRIRSAPVPPIGRPEVPPALEALLVRGLAKDPAERPASVLELVRGLQDAQRAQGMSVVEPVLPGGPSAVDAAAPAPARAAGLLGQPRGEVVRHATPAPPDGTSPADEASPDQPLTGLPMARRPRPLLALVTLGVLVALGLGVWWVTRPVVATIAASRAGATVTFTWTYPHPRDDDAYDVWVADRVVRVGEPIVQVGADDRACMRVRVLDAAGAPRGPYSEEVCA